jgi:hypothetical protein
MNTAVTTYLAYLLISLGLTVWVARTLQANGALFLVDVFKGNTELARAVNHLLVVGFYLINLGYVSLALRISNPPQTAQDSIESLSIKLGSVLLVLGVLHLANVFVFNRMRINAGPARVRNSGPWQPATEPVRPQQSPA